MSQTPNTWGNSLNPYSNDILGYSTCDSNWGTQAPQTFGHEIWVPTYTGASSAYQAIPPQSYNPFEFEYKYEGNPGGSSRISGAFQNENNQPKSNQLDQSSNPWNTPTPQGYGVSVPVSTAAVSQNLTEKRGIPLGCAYSDHDGDMKDSGDISPSCKSYSPTRVGSNLTGYTEPTPSVQPVSESAKEATINGMCNTLPGTGGQAQARIRERYKLERTEWKDLKEKIPILQSKITRLEKHNKGLEDEIGTMSSILCSFRPSVEESRRRSRNANRTIRVGSRKFTEMEFYELFDRFAQLSDQQVNAPSPRTLSSQPTGPQYPIKVPKINNPLMWQQNYTTNPGFSTSADMTSPPQHTNLDILSNSNLSPTFEIQFSTEPTSKGHQTPLTSDRIQKRKCADLRGMSREEKKRWEREKVEIFIN